MLTNVRILRATCARQSKPLHAFMLACQGVTHHCVFCAVVQFPPTEVRQALAERIGLTEQQVSVRISSLIHRCGARLTQSVVQMRSWFHSTEAARSGCRAGFRTGGARIRGTSRRRKLSPSWRRTQPMLLPLPNRPLWRPPSPDHRCHCSRQRHRRSWRCRARRCRARRCRSQAVACLRRCLRTSSSTRRRRGHSLSDLVGGRHR